jgi:hypothetical protein
MAMVFLNAALEQMAKTIFPIVSAFEQDSTWRVRFSQTPKSQSEGEPEETPFRHSVLPSMFGAKRDVDLERAERLASCLLSPDTIKDVVALGDTGRADGLALPDGYSDEALALELHAINAVIRRYGMGEPVPCPHIDAPIAAVDSWHFQDDASVALEMVAQARTGDETMLSQGFRTALALLDVNDFARYFALEPVEAGINRLAVEHAKQIDWSAYPYSAIIIPGFGPFDHKRALSPRGRLQVQLAAKHFAQGLAPFIVVADGCVWPLHTRHRESEEMRDALIDRFGIDAKSIIVEPYARHTPSGLRNAVRRMIAVGLPLDKEALVVSNDDQLDHILTDGFQARCMQELLYLPGSFGTRISEVAVAFQPSRDALIRNPMDPLDP